jgi:hypothetical protein
VQHQPADPNDLAKQRSDIETQLLESRRDMAFDAFRKSLDTRMKQEGKLKINADNLKRLGNPSTS